jgi:hypothetical protein
MSKAKENRMSREDAQAALKRGEHLAVGATVYRRGDRLPAPPPGPEGEEPDTSLEAVVVRDADGHLTRAGMEHALRSGGSVMIGGEVITDAERLPSEEEWKAHQEARAQAAADAIDSQIASLQAQKQARAGGAGGAQAWSPAPAPSGGKGTDASAATPEDFSVAGVPTVGRTEETAPKHGRAQHRRSE